MCKFLPRCCNVGVFPIHIWALIVGIIGVIYDFACAATFIIDTDGDQQLDKGLSSFGQVLQKVKFAINISRILASLLLLISVCTKRPVFALPWLVYVPVTWVALWIIVADLIISGALELKWSHIDLFIEIVAIVIFWVFVNDFYLYYKGQQESVELEENAGNKPGSV